MNRSAAKVLLISAIALHSLILGTAMLLCPARTLQLGGWSYDGPLFFPAQSGVFLMILGGAYLAAIWKQSFAWLLVASKAAAVIFLLGCFALSLAPTKVLLVAALDGTMGAAVAWAMLRQKPTQRPLPT